MEVSNRWAYFTLGLIATPFLLFFAYLTGGGPDNPAIIFRCLFPIPSLFAFGHIPVSKPVVEILMFPGVIVGSLQFGLYGFLVGRKRDHIGTWWPIIIVATIHLFAMTTSLVLA